MCLQLTLHQILESFGVFPKYSTSERSSQLSCYSTVYSPEIITGFSLHSNDLAAVDCFSKLQQYIRCAQRTGHIFQDNTCILCGFEGYGTILSFWKLLTLSEVSAHRNGWWKFISTAFIVSTTSTIYNLSTILTPIFWLRIFVEIIVVFICVKFSQRVLNW